MPASVGGHAARGAGQQADAEARFQLAHGVAERRLRQPQLGRGARETAFARHGQEGDQVVEILAHS
jgi:hypothetical protein